MYRARRVAKLSVTDAFDEIYRKGYWKQGESLSGVGSEGDWVDSYCSVVAELTARYDLHTAVDAGCGDFAVGSRLAHLFESYKALDISTFIIERNKRRFAAHRNVEFEAKNLIQSPLPRADVILIRQVFQHLTNAQILQILDNVESSGSRFLLVAEEIPSGEFVPNLDLGSHSVLTRLDKRSGVDIGAAPFNRTVERVGAFSSALDTSVPTSVLNIQLVHLE